jgi:hypothetical protein
MQTQLDIDDALIAQVLGTKFLGRRYLRYAELEQLGLVDNRSSLKVWMDAGSFPRGLKIAGPTGKTLLWPAVEVARLVAQRIREPNQSYIENETRAPDEREHPSFDSNFDDPSQAGRNNMDQRLCLPPVAT